MDEQLHRDGLAPSLMEVEVEDRTARGGTRIVPGGEVRGAHGGFIDLKDGSRIPFHRVRMVRSAGRIVYERGPSG